MTLELVVSKVVQAEYVDLNDFNGFRMPGKVILKTTAPVPVSELPCAEMLQFGHEYASGTARIHPKEARCLFGHDPIRGERITVEARVNHRNRGMRKGGFFHLSSLRKGKLQHEKVPHERA